MTITYAQLEHPTSLRYTIRFLLRAALAISSLVQIYRDPASLLGRCGDKEDPRPVDPNAHLEASPIIALSLAFGVKSKQLFTSVAHDIYIWLKERPANSIPLSMRQILQLQRQCRAWKVLCRFCPIVLIWLRRSGMLQVCHYVSRHFAGGQYDAWDS